MDNIIRESGQGLTQEQKKQIHECFSQSQPWIIVKETKGEMEPDNAEIIINFAIDELGFYRFLEMSDDTQFRLWEEFKPFGKIIMSGYPSNDSDPLRKFAFYIPLSQLDGILAQSNQILSKYFPYKL